MRSYKVTFGLAAMSLLSGLSACSSPPTSNNDMGKVSDMRALADLTPATVKGVYTMSNDVADNRIYAYARAADGTLSALNSFSTRGKGTGKSLGSQNSLIFDPALNMFFAVNGGDNTISMLQLNKTDGTLTLLFKAQSGGTNPVSIAESGGVVFVVHAGDEFAAGNISGFQVAGSSLMPIAGSIKPLSTAMYGTGSPAQIQFAPGGNVLVVTEKSTNKIDTYTVSAGIPSAPNVQGSLGMTPYGFAFSANQKLIVTEAASSGMMKGSASSYTVAANGVLTMISNQVLSNQTSPCWIAISGNNAFVTNAQSNTVTAYSVSTDGVLSVLANGNSGTTGMAPTDIAVTETNDFLYVLNSGSASLSTFAVTSAGVLTKKAQDFPGLPATAVGLVAR